jgi:hypothetical protein
MALRPAKRTDHCSPLPRDGQCLIEFRVTAETIVRMSAGGPVHRLRHERPRRAESWTKRSP